MMKWIVSGVLLVISLIVFLVIWQQRPDEETAVDAPASEASSILPERVPELKAEVKTEVERHAAVPETEPFAIIKTNEVATEPEAG
jgi:cytoskeletal protein RodZ